MSTAHHTEPTDAEKKVLVQRLRERAEKAHALTEKQKEYCSDVCLEIHLKARKWDLDKSFGILEESLKWRLEHEKLLIDLVCPGCLENPQQHYFRALGKDESGRPVIYTTAGCHWDITLKHCYEHNIIAFEQALKSMDPGVERFVYIADLYNIGFGNMDLKTNIAFFRTIQAPYRGRLGQIFLVDPPSAIWVALRLIKPFLKPETLEKVRFVNTADLAKELPPLVGEEMTKIMIEEIEENHDKERALKKKWWKD